MSTINDYNGTGEQNIKVLYSVWVSNQSELYKDPREPEKNHQPNSTF